MGAVFALAFARDLDDILLCSIVIGLTQPLLFLLVLTGPTVAGKVRVVTGSYDLGHHWNAELW
jgi:hypothetical protein